MFGLRSDGRKIKTLDPFFKVIPNVMRTRCDSQVWYTQDVSLQPLDDYIAKKAEEGIKLSYMHIIYAALVRLLAEKPRFNRFCMEGRTYARNDIQISLAIKKELSENSTETTLKLHFTGKENIFEIKDKLEKVIVENKNVAAENNTDRVAKILSKLPPWIFRWTINLLKWLDKHGMLPKAIIEASPFHTSAFLTNVGSLGIDSIYHHLYDFGTTGIFVAMGKKKKSYIYEEDDIIQEKTITLKWVADERICDGYYYSTGLKAFFRYLKKPELLEEPPEPKEDMK